MGEAAIIYTKCHKTRDRESRLDKICVANLVQKKLLL